MKRMAMALLASVACASMAMGQAEQQPAKKVERQAQVSGQKQADKKTGDAAQPGGAMDPAMEAMMKAAAPGPQHKLLEQFEGSWIAEVKEFNTDGSVKSTSPGKMSCKMTLGGRFVHAECESSWEGMSFKGAGMMGYNNADKRVESMWVDSMGTGMLMMTGQWDDAGKVLTISGECTDPSNGQKMVMKEVTTWTGKDTCVQEMFDGKGQKMMQISYKRAEKKDVKASEKREQKQNNKQDNDKSDNDKH